MVYLTVKSSIKNSVLYCISPVVADINFSVENRFFFLRGFQISSSIDYYVKYVYFARDYVSEFRIKRLCFLRANVLTVYYLIYLLS